MGTGRKQSNNLAMGEQALEGRFRNLVKSSAAGIAVHRDQQILFANPAFAAMLGYEGPELLVGKVSLLSLYHPEERERINGYYEARRKGESVPPRYDVRMMKADGATLWIDTQPATLEWDTQPAVFATYLDITERKHAEEALRESEERFRNLIEHSLQGIVVHRDDKVLYINNACLRIFGFSSMEELGSAEKLFDYTTADSRAAIKKIRESRNRGEAAPNFLEIEGVHKSGSTLWLETVSRIVTWEGAPAMQTVLVDRTKRKHAEQALRESAANYRGLIDHAGDAIFVHDMDTKIIDVNLQACESLGYTRQELLNLSVVDFAPNFKKGRFVQKARLLKIGEPVTVEDIQRRKDGTIFPVEVRLSVLDTGGVRIITAFVRDITRRKEAQEIIARESEKLKAVIDNMDQAMTMYDSDWNLVAYNEKYKEYFELPDSVFEGNPTFDDVVGYTLRQDYSPEEYAERMKVIQDPTRMTQVWRRSPS